MTDLSADELRQIAEVNRNIAAAHRAIDLRPESPSVAEAEDAEPFDPITGPVSTPDTEYERVRHLLTPCHKCGTATFGSFMPAGTYQRNECQTCQDRYWTAKKDDDAAQVLARAEYIRHKGHEPGKGA
jgi:hypothetical protein